MGTARHALLCMVTQHDMSSSRDQRPNAGRVNMHAKTEHPPRAPLFTITMPHVESTHEDLEHAGTMLIMLCCARLHLLMPYILLQPPPKHHASELRKQTGQICTQAYTTTKEFSSPIPSPAKTIDEKNGGMYAPLVTALLPWERQEDGAGWA